MQLTKLQNSNITDPRDELIDLTEHELESAIGTNTRQILKTKMNWKSGTPILIPSGK